MTRSEEFENCKYIGLNLVQKDVCVYLDQQFYIGELKEVVIPKNRKMSKDSPLTNDEAWQLRGLAGQLNWISSQTRPDMGFGACEVSISIKDAQIGDLLNANKNIRKLKSQQIVLQVPNLMCVEECSIICFACVAFANLKKSSSQGGYIIFLCKDQKKYAPISWKPKKIQRVVKSTVRAETWALQKAIETCYMIRAISLELYKRETESGLFPIHCYTGSKHLLNWGHSTKTSKEKRLKVDVCIIREMLEKKGISSVNWCTSKIQLAETV